MEEKLRRFIDSLFEDAPDTAQAADLKAEILQNTLDRYNDLLKEGKSEEAAYNMAVAGIGDVSEILVMLRKGGREKTSVNDEYKIEAEKRRSGILIAISVMLYILCVLPIIICSNFGMETLGLCIMFAMVAIATGLLIYNGMTKYTYKKKSETVVEDFKEWNGKNSSVREKYKVAKSIIWPLTLVIYFVVSFATGAWYITWVIFLASGAIENIAKAIIDMGKDN